jgi:hypothetical protein
MCFLVDASNIPISLDEQAHHAILHELVLWYDAQDQCSQQLQQERQPTAMSVAAPLIQEESRERELDSEARTTPSYMQTNA